MSNGNADICTFSDLELDMTVAGQRKSFKFGQSEREKNCCSRATRLSLKISPEGQGDHDYVTRIVQRMPMSAKRTDLVEKIL